MTLSPPPCADVFVRDRKVERYKQLLMKQRDIMIALTQRLNERDDAVSPSGVAERCNESTWFGAEGGGGEGGTHVAPYGAGVVSCRTG